MAANLIPATLAEVAAVSAIRKETDLPMGINDEDNRRYG
jgi:hypothetical protein